ncbi:ROK family protein [Paenibacillus koleovorans]|uniref:ROK family protein n=1 Tax=Paenibacillus koleovorans TaxID=121608 RepID=UPI000FD893D0|nr:ROK family protein [Paenibacillus koleovorans]
MSKYRIGMDLGGTNIVCGLVGERNEAIQVIKSPTEAHLGEEAVLKKMADMANALLNQNGLSVDQLTAVGAGIPGLIDPEAGLCIGSSNLKWRNVRAAERLEQLIHVPVTIDNDVRMYVLGEAMYGAGRDKKVVLGVTLGTGIASALVYEGRLYYGAAKIAGEFGHIYMDGETAKCGCGLTGCLETVASATGMARQARELLAAGRASSLAGIEEAGGLLTAAHISQAYDEGDAVAVQVMQHTGRTLGKALSYAVTLYNPDVIVVGGGVANAGERLLKYTRETLAAHSLRPLHATLEIRPAELGDNAGVLGSAAAAQKRAAGVASA